MFQNWKICNYVKQYVRNKRSEEDNHTETFENKMKKEPAYAYW